MQHIISLHLQLFLMEPGHQENSVSKKCACLQLLYIYWKSHFRQLNYQVFIFVYNIESEVNFTSPQALLKQRVNKKESMGQAIQTNFLISRISIIWYIYLLWVFWQHVYDHVQEKVGKKLSWSYLLSNQRAATLEPMQVLSVWISNVCHSPALYSNQLL